MAGVGQREEAAFTKKVMDQFAQKNSSGFFQMVKYFNAAIHLPTEHHPVIKAGFLVHKGRGEHSRQSHLPYYPRHPHCPVPDGGACCCPTRQ